MYRWVAAQSEIHKRYLFRWENKKNFERKDFSLQFQDCTDDAVKWIPCKKTLLVFSPSSGRCIRPNYRLYFHCLSVSFLYYLCKALNWYWEQCRFLWWGVRQFQQKFSKCPIWTALLGLCVLTSKFNNAKLPSLASRPAGPLWWYLYYYILLLSKARWLCWNCPWQKFLACGNSQIVWGSTSQTGSAFSVDWQQQFARSHCRARVHALAPCTEAA